MISIIVPIYNSEQFLHKCIDSLLIQTYSNIEVILVNDGSIDSSLSICNLYAEKDSRVKVLSKENSGQGAARNLGLEYARGEYIAFVDSDDYISPEMYEEMMSSLIRFNADIVVCGRNNVDMEGKIIKQSFTFKKGFLMDKQEAIERFLTYNGLDGASCDKLFKKEILEDIRYMTDFIGEDIPFIYCALKKAKRIFHTGKPLYNYLQRQNSTSKSKFSIRSFGMAKYPAMVREDVYKSFPVLKPEADYFYWFGLINYMKLIEDSCINSGKHKNDLIIPSILNVLRCKYLSKQHKAVFVTIRLQIYKPLWRIRRCWR